MIKLNPVKLERQNEFVDKWMGNNGCGTLEACTGFGKSYVGILCAQLCNGRHVSAEIHVIVPTKYLQTQWQILIAEHGIRNCTVYVVNTYIKGNYSCDLLILDEIHNYGAITFRKVFQVCNYNWVLGLTATIERGDGEHSLLVAKAPILDTVTLEEAEQKGFVSKHYIFNLGIELNETEQEEYDKIESTFKSKFKKFGWDFELAMACCIGANKRIMLRNSKISEANGVYRTGTQWREWYCSYMGGDAVDEDDMYHPKTLYKDASMWANAMRSRKSFIYQTDSKVQAAREIIKYFPNKKVITFSQELESVDELTKLLVNEDDVTAKSYHSKMGKKLKQQVLKDFNNNRARVLNTAKALDEGYDVKDVDIILQLSYTSTKRQNVQRTGRGIRFKEGKIALIINIYIKNTQEEHWLKTKQQGLKPAIDITNVKEIPEI